MIFEVFMNHDFINSLIDLYKELPESSPELAVRRVAALIEGEIEALEKKGVQVTRKSLLEQIQKSIQEHKTAA